MLKCHVRPELVHMGFRINVTKRSANQNMGIYFNTSD